MTGKLHFISAGAGSGKTYRLTQILHQKLTAENIRPSGVIATTFTKKAASELRERVRLHLLKQGAFHLANAIGQARIGTVNSVCGGLLGRFAFEAGLSTEQQVLDENQASLLIKQAIDSVLDSNQITTVLEVVNRLGIEDWQASLGQLVSQARANDINPKQLASFGAINADDLLKYFPKPSKQDLTKKLLEAIANAIPPMAVIAKDGGKKNTNDYLSLLRDTERGLKAKSLTWAEWYKLAKNLPEKSAHPLAEPVNEIASRVAEHAGLHADIRHYLTLMFGLAADAMGNYAQCKQEMGVVDFIDQEQLLLNVLDHATVAETLKEELDLLLVDEFQDTSPIQLALFIKLAEYAKQIVWVGDIKQAIYGFRGSDTDLMAAVLQAVKGWGGQTEILGHSWRSRPALVELINNVFTQAFANTLNDQEVKLEPTRTEVLKNTALANWLLSGKNKDQEFAALAAGIHKLIASDYQIPGAYAKTSRPVGFADITILCRSNETVINLASVLRSLGIPVATSQPGLLATPEAVLAMACFRRLNDPSDTVASAEIISMTDTTSPEQWLMDRLHYLEQGGDRNSWREAGAEAHPLLVILAEMRKTLPILAPREALQAVMTQCDLPNRVLCWKQDAAVARIRLANLDALLALAEQYENVCASTRQAASISGLIVWLDDQVDANQDALAQPAIDAVKVMTHHAAKGLEWPVVILMDLSSDIKDRLWSISANSINKIDAHNPLKDRFIRYWPWPFAKQQKVSIAEDIDDTQIAKDFRSRAIEESKRLLYVSMTRARDLLILARSSRKPSGEWLDALGAPWLLPETPDGALKIPGIKEFKSDYWSLVAQEQTTKAVKPKPLYWFPSSQGHTDKLSLLFNPSSAPILPTKVLEQVHIGQRIEIAKGVDMTLLGTAIHACIAAAMTDAKAPLEEHEVTDILIGHQVGDHVRASAVAGQLTAFDHWLNSRWPTAKRYAEIPVQAILDNGQLLQGRIDLLLELEDGWILLDHKSNPQSPSQWEAVAQSYAGQLKAYSDAIEKASSRPVKESWLFFPVSAGAIKLC